MKLLVPIISVKMAKLIPMVLLASILAISFFLFTSPNAFATQVYESSIAKFEYPDNWKLVQIIGNGEGIMLQPIDEQKVGIRISVFQDYANNFDELVEEIKQVTTSNGLQINETLRDIPGSYIFTTFGFIDGIDLKGFAGVQQKTNTNDVVALQYIAEPSKYKQYFDPSASGFSIDPYLSPQEKGIPQQPEMSQCPDPINAYFEWAICVLSLPGTQDLITFCTEHPEQCPSSSSSAESSSNDGLTEIPNVWSGVRENTDIVPWRSDDFLVP